MQFMHWACCHSANISNTSCSHQQEVEYACFFSFKTLTRMLIKDILQKLIVIRDGAQLMIPYSICC